LSRVLLSDSPLYSWIAWRYPFEIRYILVYCLKYSQKFFYHDFVSTSASALFGIINFLLGFHLLTANYCVAGRNHSKFLYWVKRVKCLNSTPTHWCWHSAGFCFVFRSAWLSSHRCSLCVLFSLL